MSTVFKCFFKPIPKLFYVPFQFSETDVVYMLSTFFGFGRLVDDLFHDLVFIGWLVIPSLKRIPKPPDKVKYPVKQPGKSIGRTLYRHFFELIRLVRLSPIDSIGAIKSNRINRT
mgnify:CR=1 FL=1